MNDEEKISQSSENKRRFYLGFLVLLILIIFPLYFTWQFLQNRISNQSIPPQLTSKKPISAIINSTMTANAEITTTLNLTPSDETVFIPTAIPIEETRQPKSTAEIQVNCQSWWEGLIILSLQENGYAHLYAFHPGIDPQLIRLTNGPWRDITPSISPDGTQLAFASDRDGYWDLYKMDLASGEITQLTYTPEYEAYPAWSPDGLWIAYEHYTPGDEEQNGNLDIFIRSADDSLSEPIRLTSDPSADHSPSWSPLGRKLAIVSTRSGENEIWLVDLDQTENRFENISRNRDHSEVHPIWSPDGQKIAWSSIDTEGFQKLYIWNSAQPDIRPSPQSMGDWPVWNPRGDLLLTSFKTPNQSYITAYDLQNHSVQLPPISLFSQLSGISWGNGVLGDDLITNHNDFAQITPTSLWVPILQPGGDLPGARRKIIPLDNIADSSQKLQDSVDEAFYALRERVSNEAGWDYLSNLEKSFLPLTSQLEPGMQEDWLYTGRAIWTNTAPINAGWMIAVREDYGPQIFWRLYIKARFQDGSMGIPLKQIPWDFSTRQSGDPIAYMQGGTLYKSIPDGYWIDITNLAHAYGWYRSPSLPTWRVAYSSVHHNEFYHPDGLDWFSAMLEIYPREALNTPTPVSSPTASATPTETSTPTETLTRTPYLSPTTSPTRPSIPIITQTSTSDETSTPIPTQLETQMPTPSLSEP
jgi:TolB protein